MQMDQALLDDLGVTDVNDRGVLLIAKEKLSSLKIEDEETLPRTENDSLRQSVNQPQNKTRPSDTTVGEFDDDASNDNNNDDEYDDDDDELVQQLEPISDDEESTIDQQIVWDEEFQANYVINLSDSGKYNGSSSQEDLTFTDSDDDDEFDIYDGDKDEKDDLPSPEVSAVASRATQMVELLSSDNLALREKLENMQSKMNNLQMAECELQNMRTAYNELQVSCRNRESLENSTLEEMERELGRVLKSNEQLQEELLNYKNEAEGDKKTLEKHRGDLQLKNNVIQQLINQQNSFVSIRDELENTITQQRRQIEDLLKDKGQLYAQLVQSHERTAFLQKELQPYHASPPKKAHGREKSKVTKATSLVTEEKMLINHRHTNSTDEGIAEIDGPISSPVLLELLKEKDATIQKLEDQLSRLEQTLQQEGTSRNLAIRAVSMPQEARIAALEQSIEESEKIITECRGQNLKSIEELYVANRRCADLEAIIKSLHSQLAEKSARIHVLQNHNEDNDSDELNEPEWPLDPDFSRTDFAQLRDFAGDSYAESLDSGMSLTTTIDTTVTESEFKTKEDPDQVSVHFWSV